MRVHEQVTANALQMHCKCTVNADRWYISTRTENKYINDLKRASPAAAKPVIAVRCLHRFQLTSKKRECVKQSG